MVPGFGLSLTPQLGVGLQPPQAACLTARFWHVARGHTEAVGSRLEVWSGGGMGLQPGRPPEVWQSHNLSGSLAKDPVGQD